MYNDLPYNIVLRIVVARSSLVQQDNRNCRQLVCVGECWAASLFFVRVLDGDSFFYISRSVGCHMQRF